MIDYYLLLFLLIPKLPTHFFKVVWKFTIMLENVCPVDVWTDMTQNNIFN